MYGICCLLGLGTLLPFNVLITEQQFFTVRTHVAPTAAVFADNVTNLIVVSFQIVCVSPPARCSPLTRAPRLPLGDALTWCIGPCHPWRPYRGKPASPGMAPVIQTI